MNDARSSGTHVVAPHKGRRFQARRPENRLADVVAWSIQGTPYMVYGYVMSFDNPEAPQGVNDFVSLSPMFMFKAQFDEWYEPVGDVQFDGGGRIL